MTYTDSEHLCRYLLRPPVAQDRLQSLPDGRVLVRLKTASRDATTRLVFRAPSRRASVPRRARRRAV
ncbi:MAG: transposase [Candidatus Rokubacteria bacterium]|nr:transposase [Candidatus Rokubacteria bacterium]